MSVLSYLNVVIGARTEGLRKGLSDATKRVESMGQKMDRVGRSLSTRVTLPLAAIGAASFKMAADAEEAANKFDVVMGGAADGVRERLGRLTDVIPATRSELEDLAAGVQDMLVPFGVAREQAAGMSADIIELAGDIGAFNNESPARVIEAIQSSLAGASEPMLRFGVDTRVAALEAIALKHGLIEAGEEMDNTARAQAVLLAIQKDSTDAQGAAAREADNASASVRFLARDVRQLGENIGTILLPVVTPMIRGLRDATKWLTELGPQTQTVIVAVGAAAAAFGPFLVGLGSIIKMAPLLKVALLALAAPAGPIAVVTAAVVTLGSVGFILAKNWDAVKVRFQLIWMAIQQTTLTAIDGVLAGLGHLTRNIPIVGDKIRDLRSEFRDWADRSMARAGEKLHELEMELAANVPAADDAAAAIGRLRTELDGLPDPSGGGGFLAPIVTDLRRASEEAGALKDQIADLKFEMSATTDPKVLDGLKEDLRDAEARLQRIQGALDRMNDEAGARLQGMTPEARDLELKVGLDLRPVVAMTDTMAEAVQSRIQSLRSSLESLVVDRRIAIDDAEIADLERRIATTRQQLRALEELPGPLKFIEAENLHLNEANEGIRKTIDLGKELGATLGDVFERGLDSIWSFATGGAAAFADFAAAAVKHLVAVIAKLLIIKALNTFLPGVGSFLGLAETAARAKGGPVTSNRPYLVGEQGAELFVPNRSGAVLSNPQTMAVAGGGGFDASAALAVMGAPAKVLTPDAMAERSYWKDFLRAGIAEHNFAAG